ncbi:hypothetical protein AKG98_3534 [Moritella sp. JT01]|uniref:DUF4145 domain-containing protein n=1 Tax=Moritella sp. JT01 TaxID=756698 RepID=UPI00079CA6DA|nr:DUF4145 domain-containing protein [Moritella sp. JT01]KXO13309.1 hypothetical protein AKG98_3534 [Moritella sp. JT01]
MTKEKVRNHCNSCGHNTWHDVEGMHSYTHNPDEYHCMVEHAVVKCRGCDLVSFRKVVHEYDAAYPTDDGEWKVPLTVDIFPKQDKGNLDTRYLPDIVDRIYEETCNAYRDGARTLSGIGFRATIEAICNDQEIKGKELSTRINNLASKGLISKKDSIRLHSIRFLGNDAAHDIKTPSRKSLDAALIIVEHLITTVYILDKESKGKLDEIIQKFEKFEDLLTNKLDGYNSGDEFPLQKYLGKDIRLLSGSIKSVESKLDEKIGKGEFKLLSFGKKAKYLDSSDELRHYVVA